MTHDYFGTKHIRAYRKQRISDGVEGYVVIYPDGYQSWSPVARFEAAYQRIDEGMSFGHAIEALKRGHRVQRRGWNGADQFLEMQVPDEHSKMRKPYIYISPVDGELVPWLASQTDMLAEDWIIIDESGDPAVQIAMI